MFLYCNQLHMDTVRIGESSTTSCNLAIGIIVPELNYLFQQSNPVSFSVLILIHQHFHQCHKCWLLIKKCMGWQIISSHCIESLRLIVNCYAPNVYVTGNAQGQTIQFEDQIVSTHLSFKYLYSSIFFFELYLAFRGVAPANQPPPSFPVPCIFFSHNYYLHIISYHPWISSLVFLFASHLLNLSFHFYCYSFVTDHSWHFSSSWNADKSLHFQCKIKTHD